MIVRQLFGPNLGVLEGEQTPNTLLNIELVETHNVGSRDGNRIASKTFCDNWCAS